MPGSGRTRFVGTVAAGVLIIVCTAVPSLLRL